MEATLSVVIGSASTRLGAGICRALGVTPAAGEAHRFPDGELQVELGESARGRDVFVVQGTGPPGDANLVELVTLADACRRAGAARVVGVVPYLAYARQDRRVGRRSLGARIAADLIATASFDRLLLLDVHTAAIEGFFSMPVEHLTAVPVLADSVKPWLPDTAVVVAPDLGAVKLARAYARQLGRPMAVIHKTRLTGESVEAGAVMGEIVGRTPLIVDDMLSTGATIEAAVTALANAGATAPAAVVVTHALMVGRAFETLSRLALTRIVAADSIENHPPGALPVSRASVAPLLASAIRRVHRGESLAELRHPG